jgi:hypothetical protein
LIPSIIQAAGALVISFGVGLMYFPAGITLLGVSFLVFGLALERGK